MKRIFALALIFLFYNAAIAQSQRDISPAAPTVTQLTSAKEAKQIIQDILHAVDMEGTIEVAPSLKVPNAAAAMYKNKRYIAYNPAFVAAINKVSGNKWATVAIFAHELGHHIYGHTDQHMTSNPDIELQADAFTGYALRKMGAGLEDAQITMKLIASRWGSATHPGRYDRLGSIALGWSKADLQMGGDGYVAKQTIPEEDDAPVEYSVPQKGVLIILVR
jgi:hypothetical protein